jgi:hypothetical protein
LASPFRGATRYGHDSSCVLLCLEDGQCVRLDLHREGVR